MKIIKAGYQILKPDMDDPKTPMDIYKAIEQAGRTCYKSEDKITDDSAIKFVRKVVQNGHGAMLEHASMTVKFTIDRGISHEFVRHRLASFAQESTRYCNYSNDKFGNEITVIEPCFWNPCKSDIVEVPESDFIMSEKWASEETQKYVVWYNSCKIAEDRYFALLEHGATPQEARSVLPTSLKTEIVITANMREWRHMFKLRAAGETGKPHPQMLEVMVPLLNECKMRMPALFGDISIKED